MIDCKSMPCSFGTVAAARMGVGTARDGCDGAPGDLQAAAVAAVQRAHLLVAPPGETHALQGGLDPLPGPAAAETVERGEIEHVLADRKIEVEGLLLEDDSRPGQLCDVARPVACCAQVP